jgi:hypothetical protein
MGGSVSGLPALFEVPPQLVKGPRVNRRFQLVTEDSLIGVVDAVERSWKHEPQGPRRSQSQQRHMVLKESPKALRPDVCDEVHKHDSTVGLASDRERRSEASAVSRAVAEGCRRDASAPAAALRLAR